MRHIRGYVPEIIEEEYPMLLDLAERTLDQMIQDAVLVPDPAVRRALVETSRVHDDVYFSDRSVAAAVADALSESTIVANRYVGGDPVAPACEAEGIGFTVKIFDDGSIVEEDKKGIVLAVRDIAEYERLRGPLAGELSSY